MFYTRIPKPVHYFYIQNKLAMQSHAALLEQQLTIRRKASSHSVIHIPISTGQRFHITGKTVVLMSHTYNNTQKVQIN